MKKKIIPIFATMLMLSSLSTLNNGENEMNIQKKIVLNASSESEMHGVSLASDNDYNSYWQAEEKENQVLELDLQEIRQLNSVTQIFKDEDIWSFKIEASLDNKTFFTLLDNSYGVFGRVFEEGCTGYARYIRLTILKSEKGFNPTSKEFYVKSSSLDEGRDIAYLLNGTSSGYSQNYEPAKAFDGDSGTYYCAPNGNYPQSVSTSINRVHYVNKIDIAVQDYGSYEFEITAVNESGQQVTIVNRSVHTGTTFSFEVNGYYKDFTYKVYDGPGWANLVEMKINGFEQIELNNQLNSLTFIKQVVNGDSVEFSKDGKTYVKYNSQEYKNSDKVFAYMKGHTSNTKIYGTPLEQILSLGLTGIVSDYLDEAHHISKATMNPLRTDANNLYYQSETKGGEHFLELDLGRTVNVTSIKQVFNENESHSFKIEASVDGKVYETVEEYTNQTGKEFVVKVDNKQYRFVKLTIYASANQYATSTSFEVRGNGSTKRENWWQEESGVIRFYPKLQKVSLREITSRLDEFRYSGYKVIELHQPYEGLADIWAGLGGTNNYQIDPMIGTLDDLAYLLKKAHEKGLYVFMFGNVGYGKFNADYFKKACKDYALGVDSKERNWFLFSDTCPDASKWFWSDIANAYYYGYWGENGKIPTFNFNNKEWQDETKRYIDFWARFGIDGVALDAPDVYYWGQANAAEVTYKTITNTLRKNNLFSLPEGSDNTGFISNYHYSGVQNYAVSSWGGGAQSLGINAARNYSANGIDDGIKPNRDPAVALGGISIAGMNFEANYQDATETERILEAGIVNTTGHLAFLHLGSADYPGQDLMLKWPQELRDKVASIFATSNSIAALNPSGARHKVYTQDEGRYYAFCKSNMAGNSAVVPVFNFGVSGVQVQIDLRNTRIKLPNGTMNFYDANNDEVVSVQVVDNMMLVPVAGSSFRILMVR